MTSTKLQNKVVLSIIKKSSITFEIYDGMNKKVERINNNPESIKKAISDLKEEVSTKKLQIKFLQDICIKQME